MKSTTGTPKVARIHGEKSAILRELRGLRFATLSIPRDDRAERGDRKETAREVPIRAETETYPRSKVSSY